MATPVLAPLNALHREDSSGQTLRRSVQQIDNPAGAFAVLPQSDFPVGEHQLDLLFMDDDEITTFWGFYTAIMGALIPFWVPSFQPDFDVINAIGDTDTTFLIRSIGYTDKFFPDPNRVDVAFVRPDNTFLKRTVTGSVDNLNGTETLTINEDLGEVWTPSPANGVCFCWYLRLKDDVAHVEYDTHDTGTCTLQTVEDKEPPAGSGTEELMP